MTFFDQLSKILDCWRGTYPSTFDHINYIQSTGSILGHIYVFISIHLKRHLSTFFRNFRCHQLDPKYKVFLAFWNFLIIDRKATHDWMAAIFLYLCILGPSPKLYIPSNLDIDLILWHTQLIVFEVKWFKSWVISFTF